MSHRIFVDLDGVLADFDRGASDVLGMACQDFQELHGVALMWKRLELTVDFYRRLELMPDAEELWLALKDPAVWSGPPPMILTGLPLGTWAEPQKREWCRAKLGEGVPVICCMSKDKAMYCCPGDILIDDREETKLSWEDAGGRFILHRSAAESLAALAQLLNPQPLEGTA
jgi:hypothetical protein